MLAFTKPSLGMPEDPKPGIDGGRPANDDDDIDRGGEINLKNFEGGQKDGLGGNGFVDDRFGDGFGDYGDQDDG